MYEWFWVLRCPLLKWSTLESAGRHKRSYHSYRFVLGVQWFLALILVSNSSRTGALTIQYLVKASARGSVKLHFSTLYCAESMCSKVTHIINPHMYNTFPCLLRKHMDFRASTSRLKWAQKSATLAGKSWQRCLILPTVMYMQRQ